MYISHTQKISSGLRNVFFKLDSVSWTCNFSGKHLRLFHFIQRNFKKMHICIHTHIYVHLTLPLTNLLIKSQYLWSHLFSFFSNICCQIVTHHLCFYIGSFNEQVFKKEQQAKRKWLLWLKSWRKAHLLYFVAFGCQQLKYHQKSGRRNMGWSLFAHNWQKDFWAFPKFQLKNKNKYYVIFFRSHLFVHQ